MIVRPASRPLRSNRVSGRSAQRGDHPAGQRRLGVEHLLHLGGVVRPVGGQPPECTRHQPRRDHGGEPGVDEPALVVARLRPGVGEEGPQLGEAAFGHQVLERPHRVDAAQPHVLGTGVGEPPQRVRDAGPPDLEREYVVVRPGRGEDRGRFADPRPDFDDQRGQLVSPSAEPRREREARLVDGLVGDHPSLVVGRPGRGLGRCEAAAATRVAQHLPHPAPVLGEPVVRPGGGNVGRPWLSPVRRPRR